MADIKLVKIHDRKNPGGFVLTRAEWLLPTDRLFSEPLSDEPEKVEPVPKRKTTKRSRGNNNRSKGSRAQ